METKLRGDTSKGLNIETSKALIILIQPWLFLKQFSKVSLLAIS